MAEITATTTFSVTSVESYSEEVVLTLFPENDGSNALRELHYPSNTLPPIVYEDNPDEYDNFDTSPITDVPVLSVAQTLEGNVYHRWNGYVGDRPVKERWKGGDKESRISAYFLRRLMEYVLNPPSVGYIMWYPKDRTSAGYYIQIETFTVNGEQISLSYLAMKSATMPLVVGEVELTFRIIGEIA